MVLECKHVWEHISGYLDGTLDAAVLEEVQKHLEHCEIYIDSYGRRESVRTAAWVQRAAACEAGSGDAESGYKAGGRVIDTGATGHGRPWDV